MKSWAAYLSLAVNALLIFGGGGFLLYQEGSKGGSLARTIDPAASPAPAIAIGSSGRDSSGSTKFHWSQIDAPDFPTYIARLRGIGCPESTIRDIVRGELDKVYEEKKQAVVQSQQPRFYPGQGSASKSGLQSQVNTTASLDQQKEQELTALLAPPAGNDATPGYASFTPTAPNSSALNSAPGFDLSALSLRRFRAPLLPLAYTADPTVGSSQPSATPASSAGQPATGGASAAGVPNMSNGQAPFLADLQQQFLNEVGGLNQDSSDPAYRDRWLNAQDAVDEKFRTFYGGQAFIQADIARAQQSAAAASGATAAQTNP